MDKKAKSKKNHRPKNISSSRFFMNFLCSSLVILFLIGILFGFWTLKTRHFLPIKKVIVEATYQNVKPQDLKNTIEPYLAQGFFTLHMNELKNALLKIPWIFEVTIKRIWPDKLEILIGEQEVIARWNGNSFININGEIFEPPKVFYPLSLPLLTGPDDQKNIVWRYYLSANKYLQPLALKIVKMDLLPSYDLRIFLNNGILLLLASDNFDDSIKTLVKIYPKVIKNDFNKVESIDFRYKNGFAVKAKK